MTSSTSEAEGSICCKSKHLRPSGIPPLAVFEATLEHEQKVTGLINELVELALAEHDHATNIFLQWFVSEQVEEEESVTGVLEQLKLMGEAKGGLFMIDRELAKRSVGGESAETE